MSQFIYFDHAATTPINELVLEEYCNVSKVFYGNASSIHQIGSKAKSVLENSRKKIAELFQCQASELIFTSGGTEADNLALNSIFESNPNTVFISSPIEHHAVLHTLENLAKKGAKIEFVKALENGKIDYRNLEELIAQNQPNCCVSLMYINNEIGTILDLKLMEELKSKYRFVFHSDTVQSVGILPFNLKQMPFDYAVVSAHKFNGPKGVGILYVKKGNKLIAQQLGGSQERGFRSGTENIPALSALCKAIEIVYEKMEEKFQNISDLKNYFHSKLIKDLPEITINGELSNEFSPVILNISIPYANENSMILYQLNLKGICVSGGSACSSGSMKISHVISAIKPNQDIVPLRFSFAESNTTLEIDLTIEILKEILINNLNSVLA